MCSALQSRPRLNATGFLPTLSRTTARGVGGSAAYWLVVIAGWSFVNIATALGLFLVFFGMLANASWEGVFLEIGGLADHFLAAPAEARERFQSDVTCLFGVLLAVVSMSRLGALRSALSAPSLKMAEK